MLSPYSPTGILCRDVFCPNLARVFTGQWWSRVVLAVEDDRDYTVYFDVMELLAGTQ